MKKLHRKRPLSIRSRFLIVSLITVPCALTLAGVFMVSVFSTNVERRLDAELTGHINNIAATLRVSPQGELQRPNGFIDKRFTDAYSGLYWQIGDSTSNSRLRSQSLWDFTLDVPGDLAADGVVHRFAVAGPEGTTLTAQMRQIMVPTATGLKTLSVIVAADTKPLEDAGYQFAADLAPYLAGLAIFLIAASFVQVFFGLRPISTLTSALDTIRKRRAERLDDVLPIEFRPVEQAINRLLDAQAHSLEKARQRAGDLAHGLKTPLTILGNDALTLREKGETAMADEIEQLLAYMKGHVDAELARSRIVTNAGMRQSDANLREITDQIIRTLQRTPKGGDLTWHADIPPSVVLPLDPHDLRELVGNVIENAVKWASSEIVITYAQNGLTVSDDGPGVDLDKISSMTERGVRLDAKVPGTGFGLSIVREICDVYGLALSIDNRRTSGLQVRIGFGT